MAKVRRQREKALFDTIVLSCEHGGNEIPPEFAKLFVGNREVLKTHRGLDIGALAVAKHLALKLHAPLFFVTVSRLLIDLNRSSHHPRLYSEFTRNLAPDLRRKLVDTYYTPHRRTVEQVIKKEVSKGNRVLHLGIHSFTPVLDGVKRKAEFGVLYDPKRGQEKRIADAIVGSMKRQANSQDFNWRIRKNYPYYGSSDGLTTTLRSQFASDSYFGIELEMNQAIVGTAAGRQQMKKILNSALTEIINPD